MKKKLNARMEYAKFLQETVQEMAREVQNSQSGDLKKTAKDLDEFMNKVVLVLCQAGSSITTNSRGVANCYWAGSK